MKKTLLLCALGLFFLAPLSSFANKVDFTPCLPAPQNLHLIATGSDWITVAWDHIPQATEGYRAIAKNHTTGAILQTHFFDQSSVTFTNLPIGPDLIRVEVDAVCPGSGGGSFGAKIIDTFDPPPGPLVFDIVLGISGSRIPTYSCDPTCSFVGANSNALSCNLEITPFAEAPFVPVWIEILRPQNNGYGSEDSRLVLYAKPFVDNSHCVEGCIIIDYYHLPSVYWEVNPVPNTPSASIKAIQNMPPVANILFDLGPDEELEISLATGYGMKVINECDLPGDGGNGLLELEDSPQVHEDLVYMGTNTFNASSLKLLTGDKSSPTFRVVNPVKNELVLNFEQPTGQAAILELYSMNGTLAARQQLPEGVNTFSMPAKDLVPGTYVLRVHQETGVETRLVIKQ